MFFLPAHVWFRKLFHIPFAVFGVPGAKDCGKLSLGTEFCGKLWLFKNHGFHPERKRPQVEEMTKNGPGKTPTTIF